MRYQIIIEGTNEEKMQNLFEEIQNKYRIFDNCVLVSNVSEDNSIIDDCIKEKLKKEGELETGGMEV